jgi:hypothetical protein
MLSPAEGSTSLRKRIESYGEGEARARGGNMMNQPTCNHAYNNACLLASGHCIRHFCSDRILDTHNGHHHQVDVCILRILKKVSRPASRQMRLA